jgi:hypothetical protein
LIWLFFFAKNASTPSTDLTAPNAITIIRT